MRRPRAILLTGVAALLALGGSVVPAGPPPAAPAAARVHPPVARTAEPDPLHPNRPFIGYTTAPVPPRGYDVRVALAPLRPAVVATGDCPYAYTVSGTITVDRGPIDVGYEWRRYPGDVPEPGVAHFTGRGRQSVTLVASGRAIGFGTDVVVELRVVGGPASRRTLRLTCGAMPTVPVSSAPGGAPCPYLTDFTAQVAAAWPQTVTYEWRLGDGSVRPGAVHVNPGQPVLLTLPDVRVWTGSRFRAYRVTLRVTSPAGGSATGLAICR